MSFLLIDAFFQNPEPACLLLVHPDIQRLRQVEQRIFAEYLIDCLHIGEGLSSALFNAPQSQRARAARQWLESSLRKKAPGPILCSEIDLLFQPSFHIDPLFVFRQISRFTRLLILWPGTCDAGVLAYAVPEHQHYCAWRQPQAALMDLRGVSDALS